MNSEIPLYNSRIVKIFLEYTAEYYPGVDTHSILEYAGITQYEVEDHAHWFTQVQVDRFHDIVAEKTGDPDIARKAGRYSASSQALGPAKQYVLGLGAITRNKRTRSANPDGPSRKLSVLM